MNTKMCYLTTMLVATAATGAAIGLAPVVIADAGETSGIDTPYGPGLWNGGNPVGGTGTYTGYDTGSGPSLWNGGGLPAGGTGTYTGYDTASGPSYWAGGLPAGSTGLYTGYNTGSGTNPGLGQWSWSDDEPDGDVG